MSNIQNQSKHQFAAMKLLKLLDGSLESYFAFKVAGLDVPNGKGAEKRQWIRVHNKL